MRIQFNNGEYAKTTRWAGMYRETVDGETYVSVDTNSTKGTFDVKDANVVSGMKNDNYPYLFTQDGDEVILEITNSTNSVWIHLHDTIYAKEHTKEMKTNGTIRIPYKSDVFIGGFKFTVIP